jgi:hypothetical protein
LPFPPPDAILLSCWILLGGIREMESRFAEILTTGAFGKLA